MVLRRLVKQLVYALTFIFCSTHGIVIAQESDNAPNLFLSASAGVTIGEQREVLKYSAYALGAAVEYGPVLDLEGAKILVSLESGYSAKLGKGEQVTAGLWSVSPRIVRVPIMGWFTVQTAATVTPFIRFGAGISWTQFTEDFSPAWVDEPTAPSLEISDWGFAWGIGGGIRVKIDSWCSVALYLDDWVTTEDIRGDVVDGVGNSSFEGLNEPVKMTMIGLRGSFTVF